MTFAAAIAAVMLEHYVTRRRDRQTRLEAAALELDQVLPTAVTGMSEVGGPRAMAHGTPYWAAYERSTALITQLRVDARRHGIRNRKAIQAAVDDKAARLGAAFLRSAGGHPLSAAETVNFTTMDLSRAVFGEQSPLGDAVDWYVKHGFEHRPPKP